MPYRVGEKDMMKKKIVGLAHSLMVILAGVLWFLSRPKEMIRFSGYAVEAGTKEHLQEHPILVLDEQGKELALVETDDEGYFYTRLEKGKKYRLEGDDFSVWVTARGVNDYKLDNEQGQVILGKRMKRQHFSVQNL